MADETAIALIEEQADASIRRVYVADRWYFSIIDVVGFLTGNKRPRKYWSDLKVKLTSEGFSQLSEKIGQLKMPSPADGKMYATDAADMETTLRIIQSVPSPKAEPIRQWLAKVGAREIEQAARPIPVDTAALPVKPPIDAPAVAWAEYHEAMAALYRRAHAIETTLADHDAQLAEHDAEIEALHSRVESVEEVQRHILPELLERLGPRTLSIEHQHTVQQGVRHLADLLGLKKPGSIYSELNDHFHVPRYAEIPEARWEEVAEWFRARIQAAERQRQRP
jgi:hypothetical protein